MSNAEIEIWDGRPIEQRARAGRALFDMEMRRMALLKAEGDEGVRLTKALDAMWSGLSEDERAAHTERAAKLLRWSDQFRPPWHRGLEVKHTVMALNLAGGADATVPPGTTAWAQNCSQVTCRYKRLWVEKDLAPAFVLLDFRVGVMPQLGGVGELACSIFWEDSAFAESVRAPKAPTPIPMKGDEIVPGMQVSVVVRNVSGCAMPFRAGLEIDQIVS